MIFKFLLNAFFVFIQQNKAQKDIDKTTNNAAKIRLKNYQEEIELLQNKNKLTKVELDIAKAKYDVLLAEIALEEA